MVAEEAEVFIPRLPRGRLLLRRDLPLPLRELRLLLRGPKCTRMRRVLRSMVVARI